MAEQASRADTVAVTRTNLRTALAFPDPLLRMQEVYVATAYIVAAQNTNRWAVLYPAIDEEMPKKSMADIYDAILSKVEMFLKLEDHEEALEQVLLLTAWFNARFPMPPVPQLQTKQHLEDYRKVVKQALQEAVEKELNRTLPGFGAEMPQTLTDTFTYSIERQVLADIIGVPLHDEAWSLALKSMQLFFDAQIGDPSFVSDIRECVRGLGAPPAAEGKDDFRVKEVQEYALWVLKVTGKPMPDDEVVIVFQKRQTLKALDFDDGDDTEWENIKKCIVEDMKQQHWCDQMSTFIDPMLPVGYVDPRASDLSGFKWSESEQFLALHITRDFAQLHMTPHLSDLTDDHWASVRFSLVKSYDTEEQAVPVYDNIVDLFMKRHGVKCPQCEEWSNPGKYWERHLTSEEHFLKIVAKDPSKDGESVAVEPPEPVAEDAVEPDNDEAPESDDEPADNFVIRYANYINEQTGLTVQEDELMILFTKTMAMDEFGFEADDADSWKLAMNCIREAFEYYCLSDQWGVDHLKVNLRDPQIWWCRDPEGDWLALRITREAAMKSLGQTDPTVIDDATWLEMKNNLLWCYVDHRTYQPDVDYPVGEFLEVCGIDCPHCNFAVNKAIWQKHTETPEHRDAVRIGGKVQIFVQDIDGKTTQLWMNPATNCIHSVTAELGFHEEEQMRVRGIFGGKQLEPWVMLAEYKVCSEATIKLTGSLPGGAPLKMKIESQIGEWKYDKKQAETYKKDFAQLMALAANDEEREMIKEEHRKNMAALWLNRAPLDHPVADRLKKKMTKKAAAAAAAAASSSAAAAEPPMLVV